MRQKKETETCSRVVQRYKLHVCMCVCMLVGVCWCGLCGCEVTSGNFLSTQICASPCLAFPLWLLLSRSGYAREFVCIYSQRCTHSTGLKHKINHHRWRLWNLITLIICTGLSDSPFALSQPFHASASEHFVYLHLGAVHSCIQVYVIMCAAVEMDKESRGSAILLYNKHAWIANK